MFYLASQSPRRRELLEQIQVDYQQIAVQVDETPHVQESPTDYVQRLALAKAQAGRIATHASLPVLGADTTVVCAGQLLGKPNSPQIAQNMLEQLSGRSHQVLTAVALVAEGYEKALLSRSQVTFKRLTSAEIAAYVATGEPLDKAGGYAIQGRAAVFVTQLNGSYSGVMGLPLYETGQLLAAINIVTI